MPLVSRRAFSRLASYFWVPALALVSTLSAPAQTFTSTTGTLNWSGGTSTGGWTVANPTSGTTAALTFNPTFGATASTVTSSNDITAGTTTFSNVTGTATYSNVFTLNTLALSGTGPTAAVASVVNITGNPLEFNGANNTMTLSATNGTGSLTYNLANNIIIGGTALAISETNIANQAGLYNFSGTLVSNSGNLTFNNLNTTQINNLKLSGNNSNYAMLGNVVFTASGGSATTPDLLSLGSNLYIGGNLYGQAVSNAQGQGRIDLNGFTAASNGASISINGGGIQSSGTVGYLDMNYIGSTTTSQAGTVYSNIVLQNNASGNEVTTSATYASGFSSMGSGLFTQSSSDSTLGNGVNTSAGLFGTLKEVGTGFNIAPSNIILNQGTLWLQPTSPVGGSGRNYQAETNLNAQLTYAGGGTLELDAVGTGTNSLTFQTGNAADSSTAVIAPVGAGTLVIAPTAGASQLGLIDKFSVIGSVNSTALPKNAFGIASPTIFVADTDANKSGDFVSYKGTTGTTSDSFESATTATAIPSGTATGYTGTTTTGSTASSTLNVSTAQTVASNTSAYALRVGGTSVGVNGATLTLGNGTVAGLILNGATISGTGTLAFGAAEPVIYTSLANGTISTAITGSNANYGLVKTGAGTLFLANGGTTSLTSTSGTYVDSGALDVGTISTAGNSGNIPRNQLDLYGGVLEGNGTYSGVLATAVNVANTVSVGGLGSGAANTVQGGGGFAANGGNLTVSLSLNGTANAPLVWGSSSSDFLQDFTGADLSSQALLFGSTTSNGNVNFTNNIDLGTATPAYYREFYVYGSGLGGDSAQISGVISDATGNSHGLLKDGDGTLILSGNNTYPGTTVVSNGALLVNGLENNESNYSVLAQTNIGSTTISGGTATSSSSTFYAYNPVSQTWGLTQGAVLGGNGTVNLALTQSLNLSGSGTGNGVMIDYVAPGLTSTTGIANVGTLTIGNTANGTTINTVNFGRGSGMIVFVDANPLLTQQYSQLSVLGGTQIDDVTILTVDPVTNDPGYVAPAIGSSAVILTSSTTQSGGNGIGVFANAQNNETVFGLNGTLDFTATYQSQKNVTLTRIANVPDLVLAGSGTDSWSAASSSTNWVNGAGLVSGTNTAVGIDGGITLAANSTITTTNDIATGTTYSVGVNGSTQNNVFVLNTLDLGGTSASTGTSSVTLTGNPIEFTNNGATGPDLFLNTFKGTSTAISATIDNNLIFNNNTTVAGSSTAVINLAGQWFGSGNFSTSGSLDQITLNIDSALAGGAGVGKNANYTYSGNIGIDSGTSSTGAVANGTTTQFSQTLNNNFYSLGTLILGNNAGFDIESGNVAFAAITGGNQSTAKNSGGSATAPNYVNVNYIGSAVDTYTGAWTAIGANNAAGTFKANSGAGDYGFANSGSGLFTVGALSKAGDGYAFSTGLFGDLQFTTGSSTLGLVTGAKNLTLNAGTIWIQPATGSGAVLISGQNVLGSQFTYGGGGTLELDANTNTSLQYQVGVSTNSTTAVFAPVGAGTLVIAPSAGAAQLGIKDKLTVIGSAGSVAIPTNTFGIASPTIFVANSDANKTGDFVTYVGATGTAADAGFEAATTASGYTGTTTTGSTASSTLNVTTAQTVASNTNAYALRVTGTSVAVNASTALTLGNGTVAGLILNGGTISGSGTLAFGAAEPVVYTSLASGTIATAITSSGAIGLVTTGPGTLYLTNGGSTISGPVYVDSGTLDVGTISSNNLPSATQLNLYGGVLQGNGTFSRSLGTTSGAVSVGGLAAQLEGGGGFSARAGTLTVNLGGSSAGVTWGSTAAGNYFLQDGTGTGNGSFGQMLVFGSSTSDSQVVFQNPIALGATSGDYYRDIYVVPGTSAGTDSAALSGVISDSSGSTGVHGLLKDGAGTLILNGNNTYAGLTDIANGALYVNGTTSGQGSFSNTPLLNTAILTSNGTSASASGTPSFNYNNGTAQATGAGALLGGTGTIGLALNQNVYVNGASGTLLAHVAAGVASSVGTPTTGTLTIGTTGNNNSVIFGTNSEFDVFENGSNSQPFGQLNVNGTVTLNATSGTLSVSFDNASTTNLTYGGVYTILNSTGLTNTFSNFANNAAVFSAGNPLNFVLNYTSTAVTLTYLGNEMFTQTNSVAADSWTNAVPTTGTSRADWNNGTGATLTSSSTNAIVFDQGRTITNGAVISSTEDIVTGTSVSGYANAFSLNSLVLGGTSGAASTVAITPGSGAAFNFNGTSPSITLGTTSANVTYTVSVPIILTNNLAINGATPAATTFSGAIVGASNLTFSNSGAGVTTFSGVNTYTGSTTVNAGALAAGSTSAFGNNSDVTLANVSGASLNITGFNNTIGSLSGGGTAGGNVTLGAATLTTGADNATTTYGGVISGTGALTKTGTGTFTLTGSNSYTTGGTNINGGTIAISAVNNLGNSSNALTFSNSTLDITSGTFTNTHAITLNNAATIQADSSATTFSNTGIVTLGANTLTVQGPGNVALGGVISGTGGGVTLTSSGTLTLLGANTYTGATTINSGTLATGSTTALGGTTSSGVTIANNANAALVLASSNLGIGSLSGGGSLGGNVSLNAFTLTTGTNGSSTTYAGIISGAGGLTKTGTGNFTLTGSNSYDGVTAISAGSLSISGSNNIGDASVNNTITLGGGTLDITSGTFDLGTNRNVTLTSASNLEVDSGTTTVSGAVNFGANALTIIGGGNENINGVISGTGTGTTLTKSGSGTLILNGNNTYAGATSITNGAVIANGNSTGEGSYTVTGGATSTFTQPSTSGGSSSVVNGILLGGNGTIGMAASKTITVSSSSATNVAHVAPGLTSTSGTPNIGSLNIGTLGNSDALTFGTNSELDIYGYNSSSTQPFGTLNVNGNLTLNATATTGTALQLLLESSTLGSILTGTPYTFLTWTGSLTGGFDNYSNNSIVSQAGNPLNFLLTVGTNSMTLTYLNLGYAFTQTGTTTPSGGDQWSLASTTSQPDWNNGAGATLISSSTTSINFDQARTFTSGLAISSTNDIATGNTYFSTSGTTNNNVFQLNSLYLGGSTVSGHSNVITISGNALQFVNNGATAPTITLGGTGAVLSSSLLDYVVSNNIILNNNTTFTTSSTLTSTGEYNFTGSFSGSGAINLSPLNTTSGAFFLTLGSSSATIPGANNTYAYQGNINVNAGELLIGATSQAANGYNSIKNDFYTTGGLALYGANNGFINLGQSVLAVSSITGDTGARFTSTSSLAALAVNYTGSSDDIFGGFSGITGSTNTNNFILDGSGNLTWSNSNAFSGTNSGGIVNVGTGTFTSNSNAQTGLIANYGLGSIKLTSPGNSSYSGAPAVLGPSTYNIYGGTIWIQPRFVSSQSIDYSLGQTTVNSQFRDTGAVTFKLDTTVAGTPGSYFLQIYSGNLASTTSGLNVGNYAVSQGIGSFVLADTQGYSALGTLDYFAFLGSAGTAANPNSGAAVASQNGILGMVNNILNANVVTANNDEFASGDFLAYQGSTGGTNDIGFVAASSNSGSYQNANSFGGSTAVSYINASGSGVSIAGLGSVSSISSPITISANTNAYALRIDGSLGSASTTPDISIGSGFTLFLGNGTATDLAGIILNGGTIGGAGNLSLAAGTSGSYSIYTSLQNGTIAANITSVASSSLLKFGAGTLYIKGTLGTSTSNAGVISLNAGALDVGLLNGTTGTNMAVTNLDFHGGVLQGYGTFSRSLGTAASQIGTIANGGFAGDNSSTALTVSIGGGSGIASNGQNALVWGQQVATNSNLATSTAPQSFLGDYYTLMFGSNTSSGLVNFTTGIDLGATSPEYWRTVYVTAGGAAAGDPYSSTRIGTDSAQISGVISDNLGGLGNTEYAGDHGVLKDGDGTLILSANNSYTGQTDVANGALFVNGNTSAQQNYTVTPVLNSTAGVVDIAVAGANATFVQASATTANTYTAVSGSLLGGNGNIGLTTGQSLTLTGGNSTVLAHLAPGLTTTTSTPTIGTLTVGTNGNGNSVNFAGNTSLDIYLDANTANASQPFSLLNVNGAVTLTNSNNNLTLIPVTLDSSFAANLLANSTYTILTTTSGITGAFSNAANGSTLYKVDGSTNTLNFVVNYSGNNVTLTYTPNNFTQTGATTPGGGDQWSLANTTSAPDWNGGNGTSLSAGGSLNTSIAFESGITLGTTASITSTNDLAGTFNMNNLTLGGTTSGTGVTLSITGNQLGLVTSSNGTTPTITLSGLAANGALTYNVSTPIALTNNTTINGSGSGNFNFTGAISGSGSLTYNQTGTGVTSLSGADTYTGATTVNSGTLALAFSGSGSNIINNTSNSSSLVLGGGNLTLKGGGSGATNSQRFNGTTLSADTASTFTVNQNSATSVSATLGALTRNSQSTVDFTLPSSGTLSTTSTTFATNGVLTSGAGSGVAFATANGGTTWATNTAGTIGALSSYSTGTGNYTSTNNVDVTNGDTLGAGVTVNTLRFNAATDALTLTGNNIVNAGGILVTPTSTNASITGGTLKAGSGNELVLLDYGNLNISSNIADNGSSTALTSSGTGTTTLSGSNTYTGATAILSGTLQAGSNNAFGSNSAVILANKAGATLNLNGHNNSIGSLTGGGTTGGNVTLGSNTLTVGTDGTSPAAYSGAISGTGNLTKTGTGTLTLAGTNTYTGATTIGSGGTLQIGNGGTSGSINTSSGVSDSGTLAFNRSDVSTFSPSISGAGGLNQAGTGTTILSGSNSYTGATTISSGILQAGSNQAFGNNSAVTLANTAGATLSIGGYVDSIGSLAGGGLLGGNVNLGGSVLTVGGNNTSTVFSGIIGGSNSSLIKAGTGILNLSGNNTYLGSTTVNGGTLQAGSFQAFGSNTAVTLANATGATLDLNNYSNSIGSLTGGGTSGGNVTLGVGTLTIGSNGYSTTYAGNITGYGGVTKTGTGTLTFTGTNTYSNVTNISAGTVAISATNELGDGSSTNLIYLGPATALDVTSGTFDLGTNRNIYLNGTGSAIEDDSGTVTISAPIVTQSNTLTVTGSGNTTINGSIYGSGGLTKSGTGTLTLSGANNYSGTTSIVSGTIFTNSTTALGTQVIKFTSATNVAIDLNSNLTIGSMNSGTGTNIILNGYTLTFGADNATYYTGGTAGYLGVISGTGGITKDGSGLQGINGTTQLTYTGPTTVNYGGLQLNYGVATNFIQPSSQLVLGGGYLRLGAGIAGTFSQTFSNTVLNAGGSSFTDNAPATGEVHTTALQTITRSTGATLNFNGTSPNNSSVIFTTSNSNDASGMLGPWATAGAGATLSYVTVSGGDILAYAGTAAGTNLSSITGTTGNWTTAAANTVGANYTINTLQYTGNGTTTTALGGNTLTVNGLMNSDTGGSHTWGISSTGSGGITIGSNNELVIIGNGNAISIAAPIADGSSSSALTFDATTSSTLTLSGVNTYSGVTSVTGTAESAGNFIGTLSINSTSSLGNGGVGNTIYLEDGVVTSTAASIDLGTNRSITVANSGGISEVSNGTMIVDGNITVGPIASSTLSLGGSGVNGTLLVTGNISGAGGIATGGSAFSTLSGTNTYVGPTTIGGNAGFTAGSTSAFGNNSAVVFSTTTGTLNLNNFNNSIGSLTSNVATTTDSVVLGSATLTIGGDNSSPGAFSGVISGTGGITKVGLGALTLSGANTYSGATTISSGTLVAAAANTLSSSSTVALGNVSTAGLNLNGFSNTIGSLSGGGSVGGNISLGSATLTTGIDNTSTTYGGIISGTGSLTKTGSGTMTLFGDNTYSGATSVNQGGLTYDFGPSLISFNLNPGSPLYLGGGTLTTNGQSGTTSTETFSNTTLTSGASTVTLNQNGATSVTDVLGSITQTQGATVNFSNPPQTTGIIATTTNSNVNGILGTWATAGTGTGLTYATVSGGDILAYTGGTTVSNSSGLTDTTGTVNYNLTGSGGTTPTPVSANTVRYTGAAGTTNLGSSFTVNGLQNAGTGLWTIASNNLTIGANQELVITGNGQGINISSTIQNNGAGVSALTDSSVGTLTLSGSNTYSGTTYINAGTLAISATNNLGDGSATNLVSINGGTLDVTSGTFDLGTNRSITLVNAPGTLQADTGATVTVSGSVNNGGNLLNVQGVGTTIINGVLSGSGGLTESGPGALALTNANTYTGVTSINGGTIAIIANNNLGAGTSAININNGTLDGATGAFTVSRNILLNTSGNLEDDGGTMTVSGVISGGSLTKTGTGTVALSGTNTYTGSTSVNAGTLAISAVGNLGDSTQVTNTINLNTGGTLDVTSTTFSLGTNRAITVGTGGGTIQDDSGTVTVNGNVSDGSNTLTVQGAGNTAISGNVSGTGGGITKNGAGTLTLSGTNSYTGATTINAGTITVTGTSGSSLGNNSAVILANVAGAALNLNAASTVTSIGSLSGGGTTGGNVIFATGGQTLSVGGDNTSTTYGGVMSGSSTGSLTKTGTGTLTLTGTNTYGVGTNINGGTLAITQVNSLGATGNSLSFNNGTLDVVSGTFSNAHLITLNGAGTIQDDGGTFTNTSAINLGTGNTLTIQGVGNTTLGGAISSTNTTGGLTMSGSGTLTLSGTNTYTNTTTINSGTVAISASQGLGNITNALVFNGGTLDVTATATATHAITLNGNATIQDDSGTFNNQGAINLNTNTLTIQGSGNTTFNGGANISGAGSALTGSIVKNGTGTLSLSGSNSYTGATYINLGTIAAGGANPLGNNSAIILANAADSLTGSSSNFSIGSLSGGGSLGGNVNLYVGASTVMTVGGDNTSTTYAGIITGSSNGITKTGTGTLTLLGASTYVGTTTINQGTIAIAGANGIGGASGASANNLTFTGGTLDIMSGTFSETHTITMTGTGTIQDDSGTFTNSGGITTTNALTIQGAGNVVLSGGIGGAGGLIKNGSGTLTLSSGSNNYTTGGTTINGGTVAISGANNLGNLSNALVFNGGTLDVTGGTYSNTEAHAITLNGGGTIQTEAAQSFTNSGTVDLGTSSSNALTIQGAGNTTLSGAISDAGNLTMAGSGTLTLSSASSSYTGATNLNAGTVAISNTANLGATNNALNFNGGTLQVTAGTLTGTHAITMNTSGTIQNGGTSFSNSGTVDLGTSGTVLTVQGTGSTTLSGNISDNGGITKLGTGTLTLSGSNSYVGPTVISGGTLTSASSNALKGTTAITVNTGGTLLFGTGSADSVNHSATVSLAGGTIGFQAGLSNTAETLGALTLTSSSVIDFGTGNGDTLTFASLSGLSATNTLSIYNWSGSIYWPSATTDTGGSTQDRLLFSSLAGLTSSQLADISFYSDSGTTLLATGVQISYSGTPEIAPVPEPSTIFGSLCLLGLIGWRSRRQISAIVQQHVLSRLRTRVV